MTTKQRKAEAEYQAALASYQATRSQNARWRVVRALRKWLLAGGAIKLTGTKESVT